MASPLIDALTVRHGFATVGEETVDAFLGANGASVLFFPGDFERLVESADVAVILPEILKQFEGRLTPALVERRAERALQRRYRFNAFPALVFLKAGGYLGTICRVLDWQVYLAEIATILEREPSDPPPFEFPGCVPAAANGAAHEFRTLWRSAMSGLSGLVGPGTQPSEEDGAELAYMEMPKAMRTYSTPGIPEKEEAVAFRPALAKLDEVLETLRSPPPAGTTVVIGLNALDKANRDFIGQVLGEGEVSIIAGARIQAQEAVMAGIWRVYEVDGSGALIGDRIEVGDFPASVLKAARDAAGPRLRPVDGAAGENLMNAPAIATELADRLAACRPGSQAHVVNLSLLPLTEEDLAYLDRHLGQGAVTILSRGYGNCRISSTAVKNAWRVRYFNSREVVILDTVEVVGVPAVACAAPQDLEDSAQRLGEILGVYR